MAEVKEVTSVSDAVDKSFLKKEKVYIKAVVNNGLNKYDREPGHMAYWISDGAFLSFALPRTPGIKDKLFPRGDAEQKFFESYLGSNLDPNSKDDTAFFNSKEGRVVIRKDDILFGKGIELDLAKPEDNIKFRILNLQREAYSASIVCPLGEEPIRRKDKLQIIGSAVDAKKETEKVNMLIKVANFVGSIQHKPEKLREFLQLLFWEGQESQSVSDDMSGHEAMRDINRLMIEPKYTVRMYKLIENEEEYNAKCFLFKGIQCAVFSKTGVNSYRIEGVNKSYSFVTILKELEDMKKNQDDVYILAKTKVDSLDKPKKGKE